MSAINQMLCSLDQRGAVDELLAPLRSQVRVVPQRRASIRPGLALLAAALFAAAWLSLRLDLAPQPLPHAASPQVALPAAKPSPLPRAAEPAMVAPAAVTASLLPPIAAPSFEAIAPSEPVPVNEVAQAQAVPPVAAAKPRAAKPAPISAPQRESVKLVKQISPQQQADNEFRNALVLLQQGRTGEAGAGLGAALQLNPAHHQARQMLVGLLLETKRTAAAAQLLREGLQLDPRLSEFSMALARVELEQGDAAAALATLQAGLAHAAERAEYQAFYAALLQRQQRHGEAIEHYSAALRNAPQSGVWLMGLGISLQAENRTAEAQEAFARAKASNSLSAELQAFVEQRLRQLAR